MQKITDMTVPISPAAREVVFIDSRVPDWHTIVAALRPGVQAVVLNDHEDGVAQMARALQGEQGLVSISVVSHGDAGDQGAAFVAALAQATGADVAASSNSTGGTGRGGDWALEVVSGSIEAAPSQAMTESKRWRMSSACSLLTEVWISTARPKVCHGWPPCTSRCWGARPTWVGFSGGRSRRAAAQAKAKVQARARF